MSATDDRYRDWDAAYVLGSLAPSERREYERHLAECAECASDVAEFTGMPGLLSSVPHERAFALLDVDAGDAQADPETAAGEMPPPASLVGALARKASAARRRSRLLAATLVVGAAAAAAVVALVLPAAMTAAGDAVSNDAGSGQAGSGAANTGYSVALAAMPGVPVSANVRFVPEAWGTRIEMDCSYGELPEQTPTAESDGRYGTDAGAATGSTWEYVMYVTDSSGAEHPIGSWTSTPGSTMHPSLSTGLTLSEISKVDVRAAASGTVVLTGAP